MMHQELDRKQVGKKVTIDLPQKYIDIIDTHCNATLLTRRKWFFDAMMSKLKEDDLLKEK
ncbi:hypothetical protein OAP56_05015 [Rickettsiaceae bacterium]|nr:hypothetical protein [Rickettsiaceae bacterium]